MRVEMFLVSIFLCNQKMNRLLEYVTFQMRVFENFLSLFEVESSTHHGWTSATRNKRSFLYFLLLYIYYCPSFFMLWPVSLSKHCFFPRRPLVLKPGGHFMQDVEPASGWYLFLPHFLHLLLFLLENLPALHFLQVSSGLFFRWAYKPPPHFNGAFLPVPGGKSGLTH